MKRQGTQGITRLIGSRKRLLAMATIGLVALGIMGGGVYAALGGAGQSQSLSSSPINLDSGLVAHWAMNGNTKDSTPYANDGTGNTAISIADRKGKANSAYDFSSGGYFTVPDAPSLSSSTSLSLSGWVYLTSYTGASELVVKGPSGAFPNNFPGNYDFSIRSAGKVVFTYEYGGTYASPSSSSSVPLNTWTHIGVTFSTTTNQIVFYINGSVDQTDVTLGTITTNNQTLFVGHRRDGQTFPGYADDIRIYNRALNGSEATALYNSYDTTTKLNSGSSGLIAQYKFDGNAFDATPNALGLTPTNVTLATDRKLRSNSAYSFNGTTSCLKATIAAAHPLSGLSAMTESAWVYLAATPSPAAAIVRVGDTSTERAGLNISASRVPYLEWHAGTIYPQAFATAAVPLGTWTLVTVTRDASNNIAFYINGVLSGTSVGSSPNNTANSLLIGSINSCTAHFLNGSIDDVRVYNRALSATEVQQQADSYNAVMQISNLQKGLKLDLPFNGNGKDVSPNAYGGTVNATLTADRKGRANSAYDFNGTTNYINTSYSYTNAIAYSQSAWFKTTSSGINQVIMQGRGNGGAGTGGITMAMGGTPAGGYGAGHFVFGVDANSCFVGVYSPLAYNDGNWHQAVGIWAGATGTALASSQFQLYVDGVVASTPGSASTAGCATSPQSSDPVGYRIGVHPIWGGFYTGSLDDIRVWDRALSASEALAAYQSYR